MPTPSDLVHENSITTGTGSLTLSNVNGKRSFNTAFGTGGTDLFDYFVSNRDAAEWERGTGHLSSSSVLVRDTVKASSNAGAAVNFSAGTKDVVNDVPAARQVFTNESNEVSNSLVSINGGPLAGFYNRLMNGCMRLNLRGSTSVADDTYCFDRWYVLSQTGSMTISQTTAIENGWPHAIKILQGNTDGSSNHRMGLAQIIEGVNCSDLRGKTVTFSARVRQTQASGSAAATIRLTIIEWTGTADSVTSDFINDWTSGTYTAGNFFTSTSTTVSVSTGTSVAHNTATTLSVTATLGSSLTNVAVLITTDATNAQNNYLEIGKAQLEISSVASTFERRPLQTELKLCAYYYTKSWSRGTAVGTTWTAGADGVVLQHATGSLVTTLLLPDRMRATPTITVYDSAGASNKFSYYVASWNNNGTVTDVHGVGDCAAYFQQAIASSIYTNFHFTAESEL